MKKGFVVAGALLVTALVLGMTVAVFAAPVVQPNALIAPGRYESSGTVTANATVNSKLVMTIDTPDAGQSVDFAAADPGSGLQSKDVTVAVQSNKDFTLAITDDGGSIFGAAGLNFVTSSGYGAAASGDFSGAGALDGLKPGKTWKDTYSINPDFNADAGTFTGQITYTVTQN